MIYSKSGKISVICGPYPLIPAKAGNQGKKLPTDYTENTLKNFLIHKLPRIYNDLHKSGKFSVICGRYPHILDSCLRRNENKLGR